MRFIQDLSPETICLLERIYRQSRHHQVRQRAHCIVLSFQGFTLAQLMSIFGVSRKTLHNWLRAWETEKFVGLYDQPGRGRKPTFTVKQKEQIQDWVKQDPKNLKQVLAKVKKAWGISVSKDTIKRVLKALNMSWHRMRRVVNGQPSAQDYQQKQQHLEQLKRLDEQGEIDLRYFDETGFCLTPYVPYAWQDKGTTTCLNSAQSKRLNILGLMNRSNDLSPYLFEGRVTSEVVIACLDHFSQTLAKRTVVVMERASIHTSHAMSQKLAEWQEKQLEIFWLPTYSPHLNLIEILWRFMKYEWMEVEAYEDWTSLVKYVEKVLVNFGSKYVINFA